MFIEIKNDSEINEDVILNSKEISVIFLKKNSLHHTIRVVLNNGHVVNLNNSSEEEAKKLYNYIKGTLFKVDIKELNCKNIKFILEINENNYNDDLSDALKLFNGREKELYSTIYDRGGYNEYFIELNSLEDLNLLASMLGRNVEVSIDYNNVIPRIRLNKEDEDK
jgi:hypothetical protein